LEAEINFQLALAEMKAANFAACTEPLENAAKGFTALKIEDKANLCGALQTYFAGLLELQHQNPTRGLELMREAEKRLASIGPAGSEFRRMIDQMKPGQSFTAGALAINKRQMANAQVLITEAARQSETVADIYYKEESPSRFLCLGMARLYRSYFNMFKLSFALAQFDLVEASEVEDPRPMARDARDLLARADQTNTGTKICYGLAGAIVAILDAHLNAVRVVRAMLTRQPVPDDIDYTTLCKHLSEAENELAAGGEQNLDTVVECQQVTALIKNLRRLVGERPMLLPKKGQVSLFVMMPFSPDSKLVEDALRAVLETDPYWFQIILARDQTICENLFDNVKAHMEVVDGFLADISDLNPNVMLELGMTESDPQKRPVFVLRREDSKEPPSDLKARLYIEYKLPTADRGDRVQILAEQLRQQLRPINDIKQLLLRRRVRYLSTQYLREQSVRAHVLLDEGDMKRLQEAFPTVEELESTNAECIAQNTGLDAKVAKMIANIFRPKAKTTLRPAG